MYCREIGLYDLGMTYVIDYIAGILLNWKYNARLVLIQSSEIQKIKFRST